MCVRITFHNLTPSKKLKASQGGIYTNVRNYYMYVIMTNKLSLECQCPQKKPDSSMTRIKKSLKIFREDQNLELLLLLVKTH